MLSVTFQSERQGLAQSGGGFLSSIHIGSSPAIQVSTTLQPHNLLSTSEPLGVELSCLFHWASPSLRLVCSQVSAVSWRVPRCSQGSIGTPSSEGRPAPYQLQLQASPMHSAMSLSLPQSKRGSGQRLLTHSRTCRVQDTLSKCLLSKSIILDLFASFLKSIWKDLKACHTPMVTF